MKNEKPILFSTPMVLAILRGEKTQTRRIIKTEIPKCISYLIPHGGVNNRYLTFPHKGAVNGFVDLKPRYKIGDTIWVRETWQHTKCLNINPEDENYGYIYKADGQPWEDYEEWKWKPSIFMPREACRILLEVTNVRIEGLQDISKQDAIAEGIERKTFNISDMTSVCYKIYGSEKDYDVNPINSYQSLWEKINGKGSWEKNPFVWVTEFKRINNG